jgi:hypothetical protein
VWTHLKVLSSALQVTSFVGISDSWRDLKFSSGGGVRLEFHNIYYLSHWFCSSQSLHSADSPLCIAIRRKLSTVDIEIYFVCSAQTKCSCEFSYLISVLERWTMTGGISFRSFGGINFFFVVSHKGIWREATFLLAIFLWRYLQVFEKGQSRSGQEI